MTDLPSKHVRVLDDGRLPTEGQVPTMTADGTNAEWSDPSGGGDGGSLPASVTVEANQGLAIEPTDSGEPTLVVSSPTPDDGAPIFEVESGSNIDCYVDGYATYYGQGAELHGADSADWGVGILLNLVPSIHNANALRIGSTTGGISHTFTGDGKIGFNGASPVVQPAAPVTLGDVIAALQALGLVAT